MKRQKELDESFAQFQQIAPALSTRKLIYEETLVDFGWPPFYARYAFNINDIVTLANNYINAKSKLELELGDFFVKELESNNFRKLCIVLNTWLAIRDTLLPGLMSGEIEVRDE